MLSAVNSLSDEFSDPATLTDWLRINETEGWNADQLDEWDIGLTREGQMSLVPNTVTWFQDYRGPLVYKEVTGDFVITSRVEITDRDDVGGSDDDNVPSNGAFSLGGVMIRTPREISSPADWSPGSMTDDGTNNGENYVFLSIGHGAGESDNGFTLEVKTTRNSDSQLELTPIGPDANTIVIQTARIGSSIITLYQLPGEDWQVHRRYTRGDMPDTLQVGLVSYTDYGKVSTYSPLYHNGNRLGPEFDPSPGVPFNPDVSAGFDYARFAAPDVPVELVGVDLVNNATDQQLLDFLGGHANNAPGAGEDQVPDVADQIMARSEGALLISLPETLDGHSVTYEAEVIQNIAADLQASENLTVFRDDFGLNWGGLNEKWLLGQNGYVYVLPDGGVWLWNGSFESSLSIAHVSSAYYESPQLLIDATSLDVSVSFLPDSTLMVDPGDLYVGDFSVRLTHLAPTNSGSQEFMVSVINQAPQLSTLNDVEMLVGQSGLVVDIPAADGDGDPLIFEVYVAGGLPAQLLTDHGLYDAGLDNYSLNWGGQNEKWLQGSEGWYFLLPGGSLNRWEGSFDGSVELGIPGAAFYDDPQLLLNAVAPDVSVEVIGSQLVIDAGSQSGEFEIEVSVSDGFDSDSDSFLLNVTNQLPELAIADQAAMIEETLVLELPSSDGDGQGVVYSVEVLGTLEQQLDQQHDFWSEGEYFTDWGGQNEKWIRDSENEWFYLLNDGSLHRWTGSFAGSEFVAQLGIAVYEDPELLTDPLETELAAAFVDNFLEIQTGGIPATVTLRVTASDGFESVSELFDVTIQNAAGMMDVDMVFEDWGAAVI